MTFVAALLAWLVSLSVTARRLPGMDSMHSVLAFLIRRLGGGTLALLLIVLLPAVLVWLLLWWLQLWWVSALVGFIVLVLAFGPGDQSDRLKAYRALQEEGDDEAAYQLAVSSLGLQEGLYERGASQMDQAVKQGIAYQLFQNFFVSLFWYVAFGAPGVVMSCLLSQVQPIFRGELGGTLALQLSHAVNWIPVRLLTLSLALVGNFAQGFAIWVRRLREFEYVDRALLASAVRSSLPGEPHEQKPEDLLLLVKRAQVLWLVVLAMFTIFA
ncbi:regulatory signaling modulator protein AmpE [Saccharospirillum mangrovi]|uniref:regulatory signaling modulator protein AmpE n=1 Tax=Saccharospirillum mangrovi TaxID=2161747 RepID=UPI000D3653A7|nr:regulatory signaling modulator protein AmpE [Saccharospirillum mangrovi]